MKKNTTGKIIIGGIFFLAHGLIVGCDTADDMTSQGRTRSFGENATSMAAYQQGVMTMVEEVAPGDYRIEQEFPSKQTGVVVKHLNGTKEIIPEEKIPSIMEQEKTEKGMGLGSVLAAGLLGYMMGKNSQLGPYVYKNENLYRQSLASRQLLYMQQEQEDKRRGYTGGYWSGGRYYNPSRHSGSGSAVGRSSTGAAKTGFFSRLGGSFRGFSG